MYKYGTKRAILLALCFICISCRKSSSNKVGVISVNVVNAVPNSQPIIPIFGTSSPIQYFANASPIAYPGSMEYSLLDGIDTMYLVQSTDTTSISAKFELFSGQLNLVSGHVYTLFFAGDTSSIDTLMTMDNIPVIEDSSAGVRFINLSKGSNNLSISVPGAAMPISNSLPYKGVSAWTDFPATSSSPGSYTVIVRDASTGDSLTSYSWYYLPFRCNSLILSGSPDSASLFPLQIYQMNNF